MTNAKPDKTRSERQARRRKREKEWLIAHGWISWEAMHTALLHNRARIEIIVEKKPPSS